MDNSYWITTFEKLNDVCIAVSITLIIVTFLTLILYFFTLDDEDSSSKKSFRQVLIIELIICILCVAGYVLAPSVN